MKTFTFLKSWQLFLCLLLLSPLTHGAELDFLAQSLVDWQRYGKATFEQAGRKKQPLFVLVYSEQCHWCRKYDQESIEADLIQKRLQQDYLPVAVNFNKQPEVAKKLGVFVVPTTLLLTPDGKKLAKFHGFVGAKDLRDILDANLSRYRKGDFKTREFGNESTCCPLSEPEPKH